MAKKVMFYVQHLLGIGHLARASLICNALVDEGFDVKMVMGGVPVPGFPQNNINVEYLPPLKAGCINFNELTDENGKVVDKQYLENRAKTLLAIFSGFQPDAVMIEAFPFGRRAMRFELIPLLEAAKQAQWKPVVVGSVRDIVQEKSRPDRLQETVDTLNNFFDALMVHGDQSFTTLGQSFQKADEINIPVYHTAIVSARAGALEGRAFDVVVSAGGGVAGFDLMEAAMQAIQLCKLADASWCFLIGQNLPKSDQDTLKKIAPQNVTVATHRSDFRALLAHAKLSISQAGYNTVADILQAGCAAVFIPFAKGGQTEQTFRAEKLAKAGIGTMLSEDDLSPRSLAKKVDEALAQNRIIDLNLDLNGAANTAKILGKLL